MRKQKVKETAREMISEGRKPSVLSLSQQLNYSEPDIHRCLNALEKEGVVKTYTRDVLGTKHRMVGLNRE